MTKYLTRAYHRTTISPVEIVSESEHFVKLYGCNRREGKHTDYQDYWNTWEEAYKHVHDRAVRRVSNAHKELQDAQDDLLKVEALRK